MGEEAAQGARQVTEIPAMMLWTDAYLGDTSHLTTLEHGAYLLILMAMWRAGGALPNEELRLARTARLSLDKWRRVAPTIMGLMTVGEDNVSQKRLRLEFEIASGRHENHVRAGRTGGRAKALKMLSWQPSDASEKPEASLEIRSTTHNPVSEPEEKKEGNLTVSCPKRIRTKIEYPEDFQQFWRTYPVDQNMSKQEAYAEWKRLGPDDRASAIASCAAFVIYCQTHKDYRPIHANRYLAKGRFEGHLAASVAVSSLVFVRVGSEPWKAWDAWYRRIKGIAPPINKEGTGWHFQSEYPPRQEALL